MYAIMCSDRRKLSDEKVGECATKAVAQREASRLNQAALRDHGDTAPLYYVELTKNATEVTGTDLAD